MKCIHCNSEVADGMRFCPYCGNTMAFQQQHYQSRHRYRKRPRLSFPEALKIASQRLTEIDGRSRRSEFWWWAFFNILIGVFVFIPYVGCLVTIAQVFLMYAVFSRRLHDCFTPDWLRNIILGNFSASAFWGIIMVLEVDEVDLATDFVKLIGEDLFYYMWFAFSFWCFVGLGIAIIDGNPITDPKHGPSPKYY